MTCLEDYLKRNPDRSAEYALQMVCPDCSGGIDIEAPENCPLQNGCPECFDCWNREVPITDPQPTDTTDTTDTTGTTETVNHPKHYSREGAMECIDEMVLVFGVKATMHFCLLNAWKYRYRAADKGGEEDIKKSDWYMAKYAELKGGDRA